MGLAEKRATEEIKTKWPAWEKTLKGAMQAEIPIEVKWDTIVKEGEAGFAVEAFEKVFVTSAEKGFQEICRDKIGQEAVASTVKSIVIKNESGVYYGDRWCQFENGVLTLDHSFSNAENIEERAKGLVDFLSQKL